jgi:hypothetical protein
LPVNLKDATKQDHDFVVATWLDGTEKMIAGTTYGTLREKAATEITERGTKKENPTLWTDTMDGTSHELKLCPLVDRSLQIYAYEQGRQICGFRVDRFGPLPEDPPQPCLVPTQNATFQKALAFAIPLMEEYKKGKQDDKELKTLRDEKYLREAIPKTTVKGGQPRTAGERHRRRAAGEDIVAKPAPAAIKKEEVKKEKKEEVEEEDNPPFGTVDAAPLPRKPPRRLPRKTPAAASAKEVAEEDTAKEVAEETAKEVAEEETVPAPSSSTGHTIEPFPAITMQEQLLMMEHYKAPADERIDH